MSQEEYKNINETMKLITSQPKSIFSEDMLKHINNISIIRPGSFTLEAALEILAIGYAYGAKTEKSLRSDESLALCEQYRSESINALNRIGSQRRLSQIFTITKRMLEFEQK